MLIAVALAAASTLKRRRRRRRFFSARVALVTRKWMIVQFCSIGKSASCNKRLEESLFSTSHMNQTFLKMYPLKPRPEGPRTKTFFSCLGTLMPPTFSPIIIE